uniref:AMP-dependent synthetase/ligase domain-containing protein n=1 Tax=Parascaris equorum TaxID=6256 RepID=A0A914RUJ7_PAREQ
MRCYWDSEDMTKTEITPDRWYHTGDIGVMHENGTVSIVGRKKDLIVRGGENIYPTEVEQYLFRHPKIEDVQVYLFTYIFAVYFLICCPSDSFIFFICSTTRHYLASISIRYMRLRHK